MCFWVVSSYSLSMPQSPCLYTGGWSSTGGSLVCLSLENSSLLRRGRIIMEPFQQITSWAAFMCLAVF